MQSETATLTWPSYLSKARAVAAGSGRLVVCGVLAGALVACRAMPAAEEPAAPATPRSPLEELAERRIPFTTDALLEHVADGNAPIVGMFVRAGIDVNMPDAENLWMPLMLGAFSGHTEVMTALLAAGANPAAVNEMGRTALMLAAIRGEARAAALLAAKGAPLDTRDPGGHTALMFAANNGYIDTVRVLLEAGADRSLRNTNGYHALAYSKVNGHADIAQLLQASGAVLR